MNRAATVAKLPTATVAATVDHPSEIDDELKHLVLAVGGPA